MNLNCGIHLLYLKGHWITDECWLQKYKPITPEPFCENIYNIRCQLLDQNKPTYIYCDWNNPTLVKTNLEVYNVGVGIHDHAFNVLFKYLLLSI